MASFIRAPRRPFRDRGEPSSSTTLPSNTHPPTIAMSDDEGSLVLLSGFEVGGDEDEEYTPSYTLGEPSNRISFKRRAKPRGLGFSLFDSLSPSFSSLLPSRDGTSRAFTPGAHLLGAVSSSGSNLSSPGKVGIVDWVAEGPGRRVYDDLTAIDWSFEYTKERLRIRALERQGGLIGHLIMLYDSSQIWLVLIGTGFLVGMIAASIDVVTNWLGDLKDGFCRPSFYLSKAFCCWQIDDLSQCHDWVDWGEAFGITARGGSYIVKYIFYCIFSILFAVTASVLVTTFAIYARHSGIPEIKTVLGGFVIRNFMGSWTLLIKSFGLCLAVASGLWLGKEGPLVHVACCCSNIMMKLFEPLRKNEARKREVLSAAASAGISVAFGSPIGGVLFSLEQLSYYFPDKTMWQSFVTAMIAAVTLQFMNPFRTGKLVMYQVKYTRSWHGFEMIPFCVLGILGGLYGAFFIRFNMAIARWRKSYQLRFFPVLETLLVAIITALINYPIIFMRLQCSALVATLFQECTPGSDLVGMCQKGKAVGPILLMLLSAILGILLAAVTFGLQIPAGIILPTMAIGALYGRAMGMLVQAWQRNYPGAWFFASCEPDVECVTPGVFAIIGAASALGGVTRMTVSIVVIMFELTGALTYVLPIMIAVMISKWVGDAFGRRGIYESWIHFKEYPFLENRDDPVPDIPSADIMTRIEDLVVITATGHTIESLDNLLLSQPYKGFPVVTDTREAILLGYISRSELRTALDQSRNLDRLTECHFSVPPPASTTGERYLDLRPWMDQTPITLPQRSSLQLAMSLFQKLGLRYILFSTQGQLQGLLTKKDAAFAMNSDSADVAVDGHGHGGSPGQGCTQNGHSGQGRSLLSEMGRQDEREDDDEANADCSDPLTSL
ncbi:chloride channel [Tirmania nivea]|nr:chloride channel [Tirmania nivea]